MKKHTHTHTQKYIQKCTYIHRKTKTWSDIHTLTKTHTYTYKTNNQGKRTIILVIFLDICLSIQACMMTGTA